MNSSVVLCDSVKMVKGSDSKELMNSLSMRNLLCCHLPCFAQDMVTRSVLTLLLALKSFVLCFFKFFKFYFDIQ